MAASTPQKALCATCGKVSGVFTCRGCRQDFCVPHVAEHRHELGKQMDELTLEHDRLRQTVIEQSADVRQHPLMRDIHEWEQRCIDKVHQLADDARKKTEALLGAARTKLDESLTKIAGELQRARRDDDFFEPDLQQWMHAIEQLKNELAQPANIRVPRVNDEALSAMLQLPVAVAPQETFGEMTTGARIEDNGRVTVKDGYSSHATVRGISQYSSGQHRIRLRLEQYSAHKWVLIGIVSNSVGIQAGSYMTPSFFGWGGRNQVYYDGKNHQGSDGFVNDFEPNDVIELLIDCNQETIRLGNERTRSMHVVSVPARRCAFPWRLQIGMYHPNDRIRLLDN